jgi:2-iminobutanoate/2-iminopropanoate deaminase
MLIARNPASIQTPLGPYAQGLEAAPPARWLFVSGQTPAHADGRIPNDFAEQAELVWTRILAVLAEAGLNAEHIVQVRSYLTERANVPAYSAIKKRHLGSAQPASVGVIVPGLFNAAYLLEVEVTALSYDPEVQA